MRFVPTSELIRGMKVARDIVFTTQAAILKKNTYLTDNYLKFLSEKGFLGIYVADEMSEDIEIEETIDPEIFNSGVNAVKNENINVIIDVATDIVDDLLNKSEVSANLIDLRSFDDYTYHHSVNVGVFSVLVGKKIGLSQEDLRELCLAAICHDLGKKRIDHEILNKPGRLTDEEFEHIKEHPRHAYDFLNLQANISATVKAGVLYHHENMNGSGYPAGLSGDKIPLFAKIIHATDVYDALTSKRPYKNPYEPLDAFFYLEGGKGSLFDAKIVDAIIATVPAYPVGTDVFLSNGDRAVVVSHTNDMLRPTVRLYSNKELIDMSTDEAFSKVYILRSGIFPESDEKEVSILNENRGGEAKRDKPKIIIVDDNKTSLYHLRDALDHDYEITMFESPIDALKHVGANGIPDLMISELDMLVMSGIDMLEKIKKTTTMNIPIVFIGKDKGKDAPIKCKMAGGLDYFQKPINPIYLKERIYNIIFRK